MSSKALILLVAVALTSACLLGAASGSALSKRAAQESHDLIIGARQIGDRLVHQETIEEKYDWTGKKVIITRAITVPADHAITQVRCLDHMTDGTGAEASVTAGGPGQNFVSLRFKSQRWHGIYFNVEVFAKKR